MNRENRFTYIYILLIANSCIITKVFLHPRVNQMHYDGLYFTSTEMFV